MKINRIRFDKLRHEWKILLYSAATIHAHDKMYPYEAENELNSASTPESYHISQDTTFEQLKYDAFGNQVPQKTLKEELEDKGREVLKQIKQAIADERYEDVRHLEQVYEILKRKWRRL